MQTKARNLTPPQVAEELGVGTAKVIGWIVAGQLEAMNLASDKSDRPRYSIPPEAFERFKQSKLVVPKQQPLRRKRAAGGKDYFENV